MPTEITQTPVLYTRQGCHLCQEMAVFFNSWRKKNKKMAKRLAPLQVVDITMRSEDISRFSTRIPVLMIEETIIAEGNDSEAKLAYELTNYLS